MKQACLVCPPGSADKQGIHILLLQLIDLNLHPTSFSSAILVDFALCSFHGESDDDFGGSSVSYEGAEQVPNVHDFFLSRGGQIATFQF